MRLDGNPADQDLTQAPGVCRPQTHEEDTNALRHGWQPERHRIFPRAEDGQALSDPLLVSIDLSQVVFA